MRTGTHIPPDNSPTDEELHAEVFRLIQVAKGSSRSGSALPSVGSELWWQATDRTRIASLLLLSAAWLMDPPQDRVARALKEISLAISGAVDWGEWSRRHMTHAELQRRRSEPGPIAASFDPVAARRWVLTGDSRRGAA